MKRDNWQRLFMHLPWGVLGVFLVYALKPSGLDGIGYLCCFGMLVYEAFNDWRKHDESYKDVLGIVWGFLVGAIVIWVLIWFAGW